MNYEFEHTGKIVALFIVIPVVMSIAVIAFIAIRQDMFEKRICYKTSPENAIGTMVAEDPCAKNIFTDIENSEMIARTDVTLKLLEGEQP